MNKNLKLVKHLVALIFLTIFLTSCIYHRNIDGSINFNSIINTMVTKSIEKINQDLSISEAVVVSDFVNIDRLKNRSKLGFLLSSTLKDRLLANDITVKEIELRKDFNLNITGLNLLSRDLKDVNNSIDARYAFVGSYSITTKNLIVFIKMIDLQSGDILVSSQESTPINEEILDLERERRTINNVVYSPMVL